VSELSQLESSPVSRTAEVCLVEPEPELASRLASALRSDGSVQVIALPDAERALERLASQRCDVVVVSDQLAEPGCPALLRRVQIEHPEALRVVLTDQEGVEVFRRVPYAHQYFQRSAAPTALKAALAQCIELHTLIARPALRALVSSSNALPATPRLYAQLIDLLADPKCSMVRVVEVIQRDLGMSTRLMQLVSSAFFGMSTQIQSLGACVGYLGLNAVRSLVLSAEITQLYPAAVPGFSSELIHARALATSRLARRLASSIADEGQAFVAGLLHGVGQLVLASRAPERFQEALELGKKRGLSLPAAEIEVFGATDAQVAAYLLALWGQPLDVVRAIAHQDTPQRCDASAPGLATLIYISKRLSENPAAPFGEDPSATSQLNAAFLTQIGALDTLTTWRAVASRVAS
jgi:HD-like signal output (HDOD) protein